MSLIEAMRVAAAAVISNKMRTFLTTLGVVIGVASVIALVSVSNGASAMITGQIEALGTNMLVITPVNARVTLTLEDAQSLDSRVPALSAVAPAMSFRGTAKWGINSYETSIEGVAPSHVEVRNYEVVEGRFISAADVDQMRRIAVIGHTVLGELFKGRQALGQQLTINGQQFTVVGVLAEKGQAMGTNPDDVVFIPVTAAQRLAGTTRLTVIYARLSSGDLATETVAQIRRIFDRKFGRADQVRVQSQDELLGAVDTATRTLSLMLGGIAGISLLVGGIGIMNIMLVSVTERTREIGLRKAVGARRRDILTQFLIEALFISIGGGIIGIFLGSLLATVIARFGGWSSAVSADSIMLSFFFAGAVGVGFGMYPAMKASRLDPIASLRYE
ncbi:MAG: ABC transporter permease [Bacillota bacterium]|nr:ABC transporter permease [Bacillota bacterium]